MILTRLKSVGGKTGSTFGNIVGIIGVKTECES